MAKNIIDIVQEAAGFDTLQKVDPNTQDVDRSKMTQQDLLGQAIIPTALVGLYKYSREEDNARQILQPASGTVWLDILFEKNREEVIQHVADYADITTDEAATELKLITELAAQKIKENGGKSGKEIKDYMTQQRNNILHYLPGALQVGDMLHDNTLDDRTHKMDGPVSSTMHKIEKIFAGSDNPDEKKWSPTD
jgi:hypothetical protein